MSAHRHYLDCNATAPLRPEARAAMGAAMNLVGNPSSVHAEGRAAHAILDRAREQVALMAGAKPVEVFFTSGATEANNWALAQSGGRVAAAADSHDSALAAVAARAGEAGAALPVGGDGLFDAALLTRPTDAGEALAMLSVAAVNNETGIVQPAESIGRACDAAGVALHLDAAQAPGKVDVAPLRRRARFLSLSAHKLGGPPGVGALIADAEAPPVSMLYGGGQEFRRRAGTENLPGIAGFGAAAAAVHAHWREEAGRLDEWRAVLEGELLAACPDAVIFGREGPRAPNTSCIRMPGVASEIQVMALDLAGVAVSAGAACSSGKVTPSHVLQAMGAPLSEAAEAIRISLGWATQKSDIDACITAWTALWQRKKAA